MIDFLFDFGVFFYLFFLFELFEVGLAFDQPADCGVGI